MNNAREYILRGFGFCRRAVQIPVVGQSPGVWSQLAPLRAKACVEAPVFGRAAGCAGYVAG